MPAWQAALVLAGAALAAPVRRQAPRFGIPQEARGLAATGGCVVRVFHFENLRHRDRRMSCRPRPLGWALGPLIVMGAFFIAGVVMFPSLNEDLWLRAVPLRYR